MSTTSTAQEMLRGFLEEGDEPRFDVNWPWRLRFPVGGQFRPTWACGALNYSGQTSLKIMRRRGTTTIYCAVGREGRRLQRGKHAIFGRRHTRPLAAVIRASDCTSRRGGHTSLRIRGQAEGRGKGAGGRLASRRPRLRVHYRGCIERRGRPHCPRNAHLGRPRMEGDAAAEFRSSRRDGAEGSAGIKVGAQLIALTHKQAPGTPSGGFR